MMMKFIKRTFLTTILLFSVSAMNQAVAKADLSAAAHTLYTELNNNNEADMPSQEVFEIAYRGFQALKTEPGTLKKDIITVIDFSLPSTEKRLWIIDLNTKAVLFNDYVAHGRNSGDDVAVSFSNASGSYMSSIGFYLTGETYHGKHGLSLRLEGMEGEFNSNARDRAIVMHGADYVSADFIRQYGRLGRSLGCPSVSMDIHEQVINTIKDGTALFIYYPDPVFLKNSQLLNPISDVKV